MKNYYKKTLPFLRSSGLLMLLLCIGTGTAFAQDSTVAEQPQPELKPAVRYSKNTFESIFLLDNQTVMVPKKGSLEMAIQHRFGVVNNGVKDMFGLFAPSNIRLGMNYAPLKKLNVGVGLTKERMQVDLNDPKSSEVMGWLTGTIKPAMPLGATTNPSNINALMLAWIKQGAKNN